MGPDPTRGRGTWGQGVVSDLVVFSRLIAASLCLLWVAWRFVRRRVVGVCTLCMRVARGWSRLWRPIRGREKRGGAQGREGSRRRATSRGRAGGKPANRRQGKQVPRALEALRIGDH